MLIGYARISTQDQNLELQREALTKAGCQKVLLTSGVPPKDVARNLGVSICHAVPLVASLSAGLRDRE